jgi:sensor c-di-GMP phosphodiesterase-like protein
MALVFGAGLQQFWYLRRLVLFAVGSAVLLSALMGALLAWRSTQNDIEFSAQRAVLNAERLIERASADLQKLDVLTTKACDDTTVNTLKEAVYAATTQIREIGLIQDSNLYCTNFGAANVSLAAVAESLKVGTFISVGPNAIVANNTSLFIYTSREPGRVVNAVLNPIILAQFEQASSELSEAHLEMKYFGPSATSNVPRQNNLLYETGKTSIKTNASALLGGSFRSTKYPIAAEVTVDKAIVWKEYWQTASHLFGVLLPLLLVGALVLDRYLATGALHRMRYKRALKNGQFKVYYQPIVSSQTQRLVGLEALLRWQHPRRGLLRAAQFPELFEDARMEDPIARFVLDQVHKDLGSPPMVVNPLWCSVNIAPALLEHSTFLTLLTQYAKGLSQNQLRIEITERSPVTPAAEISIRELRGSGIKVGLDDFGTGYSNMNQLQSLAYDFIKVDGLLIRGIQSINGLSPVLDSVIQLAARIGTEIVAEGVETHIQAQALALGKVQSLQGYLFGQAKPYKEIVAMLMDEYAIRNVSDDADSTSLPTPH